MTFPLGSLRADGGAGPATSSGRKSRDSAASTADAPSFTPHWRARLALAACALWLCGVEVLPAIHEGLHHLLAPHRHDGGTLITVSFEDTTHRHPDGSIHFVAARPPTRPGSCTRCLRRPAGLAESPEIR